MFQELTANIQRNVARMFFHLGLARMQPAAVGRPAAPRPIATAGPDRVAPMAMAAAEGPKLPKKAPCWCGSGKRYEDCHGRRAHERAPSMVQQPAVQVPAHKKFKDKHKRR
jgi:hypothetical protein